MNSWTVLYEYCTDHPQCADDGCTKTVVIQPQAPYAATATYATHAQTSGLSGLLGYALIVLGLGGIVGPITPAVRLEGGYWLTQAKAELAREIASFAPPKQVAELPKAAPVVYDPLVTPDGATIDPVNTEFSVIIPKVGVNAPVVADVDPANASEYEEALKTGVAHASTSFLPDQDGTVYLFSHSTNYDWFVKDLNAVFYLVKNLEAGDRIVIIYKGTRYTYAITEKKVVSPSDITYIVPYVGKKNLILQTCWPPGSTTERLLIFADLVEERETQI